MITLSKRAILEISDLSSRAERLARGSSTDRAQAVVLTQRIASIRQAGISSDEMRGEYASALSEDLGLTRTKASDAEHRRQFDKYLAGLETRDFLAGQQAITYTIGGGGGYLVPWEYDPTVREAMAQVDELLSDSVTDFTMTPSATFLPTQVSGYDLTLVAAQLVGETVQQQTQVIPTVAGASIRSNLTFRATFSASMEDEQDIPGFGQKIVRASSVALARTIGQHIISGRGGTSDINGLVNQIPVSLSNATPGKIVLSDINNIYFSLNRWYRRAPKCAWLVNDGAYKFLRAAVDNNGRPLLDVVGDVEMLLGKPVRFCPSLGTAQMSLGITG